MKRLVLVMVLVAAVTAMFATTTQNAQAGLFGGSKSAASPSPSPSPSALPTASPEPPDVAIPRLQAKLRANPNDQQAMTELAGQFLGISRPDLAFQLSQHLLQVGDKTSQIYYIDGYAQQSLGRMDGALADFEQAEDLDPSNMSVLAQLTSLYVRAGRLADAERIAKRAVTLNPKEPDAFNTLGTVYAAQQKFDDARAQFEKAAAMDPKDSRPIFQIASTYAQQNNIPQAIASVNRALQIDPKDVQALVFKADLYARQHDDTNAAAAYDDAAVAATDDQQRSSIEVRKAQYYADEHKDQQAESTFLQTIAQYPKVAGNHVSFGDYYLSRRQTAKAASEWQAGLAIDKDNPQALLRMSQYAMQNNRPADAVGYLKHLVQVSPDAQSFAMLGQAYSYTHDYSGAKDACSKSFQISRQPSTLGCIAGADFELKNYKEASQIFDVLDQGAKGFLEANPQLLYVAGKSYQATNQKQKALTEYKHLIAMMKKGTKEYNQVAQAIADLSAHSH